MLLDIKLKQLLVTLVFTSIFVDITGIKWGVVNKAKKKNGDKIYEENQGLCPSLKDFYQQEIFKKEVKQFFTTKEGKGLKTRINADKKKRRKKQHRIHNCLDSVDYNAFLTYYYHQNRNIKTPIKLECDLLNPKISFVSDALCKTIGKYFIQFGIKVYFNFLNYLFNIGKKIKSGFLSRKLISQMKSRVKKYVAVKEVDKKKYELKIQKWIDKYYHLACSQIIPHYNAFYVYCKINLMENEGFDRPSTCDYFVRITRVNTEHKIS